MVKESNNSYFNLVHNEFFNEDIEKMKEIIKMYDGLTFMHLLFTKSLFIYIYFYFEHTDLTMFAYDLLLAHFFIELVQRQFNYYNYTVQLGFMIYISLDLIPVLGNIILYLLRLLVLFILHNINQLPQWMTSSLRFRNNDHYFNLFLNSSQPMLIETRESVMVNLEFIKIFCQQKEEKYPNQSNINQSHSTDNNNSSKNSEFNYHEKYKIDPRNMIKILFSSTMIDCIFNNNFLKITDQYEEQINYKNVNLDEDIHEKCKLFEQENNLSATMSQSQRISYIIKHSRTFTNSRTFDKVYVEKVPRNECNYYYFTPMLINSSNYNNGILLENYINDIHYYTKNINKDILDKSQEDLNSLFSIYYNYYILDINKDYYKLFEQAYIMNPSIKLCNSFNLRKIFIQSFDLMRKATKLDICLLMSGLFKNSPYMDGNSSFLKMIIYEVVYTVHKFGIKDKGLIVNAEIVSNYRKSHYKFPMCEIKISFIYSINEKQIRNYRYKEFLMKMANITELCLFTWKYNSLQELNSFEKKISTFNVDKKSKFHSLASSMRDENYFQLIEVTAFYKQSPPESEYEYRDLDELNKLSFPHWYLFSWEDIKYYKNFMINFSSERDTISQLYKVNEKLECLKGYKTLHYLENNIHELDSLTKDHCKVVEGWYY